MFSKLFELFKVDTLSIHNGLKFNHAPSDVDVLVSEKFNTNFSILCLGNFGKIKSKAHNKN